MSDLIVTTGYETMSLNREQAIALELCLNVTTVGREWKNIGDALFNFGTNNSNKLTKLFVSEIEFNFLQMLRNKTWQTCKNMSPYFFYTKLNCIFI